MSGKAVSFLLIDRLTRLFVHADMGNQTADNLITFSFGYLISPTGVDSFFTEFTVCKVCRRILHLVVLCQGRVGG